MKTVIIKKLDPIDAYIKDADLFEDKKMQTRNPNLPGVIYHFVMPEDKKECKKRGLSNSFIFYNNGAEFKQEIID